MTNMQNNPQALCAPSLGSEVHVGYLLVQRNLELYAFVPWTVALGLTIIIIRKLSVHKQCTPTLSSRV